MIVWSYVLGGPAIVPGPDPVGGGALPTLTTGVDLADLALNPGTWDIALPPRIIRGGLAVVQRIKVRFRWFLGEWFLDQRLGVPYYRDILIKNPDPVLISFIFRQVLTKTPGVKSVQSLSASLERKTRTLTVDFSATLDDGTIITADAEPFIIG